jgi:hypothetical protein
MGNDTTPPDEIVLPITTVLAGADSEVQMIAARQIPEKYLTTLEGVEVLVRPF